MTTGRFKEITTAGTPAPGHVAAPDRAARLPKFIGLDAPADSQLEELNVAVIGSGSVGRCLALHCARLQVGGIWIVDPGRFKPESLLTQAIVPSDVGQQKATNAGRVCKAISPGTQVYVFDGEIQSLETPELAEANVVALASDNLKAEVEVGQRCLNLAKPLVHAAVHGETLVAQVRLFSNRDGSGPCPACGFGQEEWAQLNKETTFSCAGADGLPVGRTAVAPTMSVSCLCSLAADLAMMQMLRYVLGLGGPQNDSLLQYCGYTHQMTLSPLARNPNCPCEHIAWTTVPSPRPLAQCSPRELAIAAGFESGDHPADLSFTVDDLVFVDLARCCGGPQPVRRFCRPDQPGGHCSACGAALQPQSFYSHRPVPAGVMMGLLDQPLHLLGAGSARWAVVRGDGQSVLIR